ncbi:MAG: hypothetical protein KCHDKBKB_01816 [Elusimicrobia bacterium]|nr:hypothetical protein [Elusimicrobiota bacterium]
MRPLRNSLKNLNALVLAILALAYLFRGAKQPASFAVVFILIHALLLWTYVLNKNEKIPVKTVAPFALFFCWSWLGLLSEPPLDIFLFFEAKLWLLLIFAVLVYANADKNTGSLLRYGLLTLATVETVLISRTSDWRFTQTSGLLANSLHSGILLPVGLACIAHELKETKAFSRIFYLLLALALGMLYALVLLRSRAALVCIGLLVIFLYPRKRLVGAIAIMCATLVVLCFSSATVREFFEIGSISLGQSTGRLSIWKTALKAIADAPLIGHGLGNFEQAYTQFQQPSSEYYRFGKSTAFAHNGLLQVAAETGIVGLCLAIMGWVRAVVPAFKRPLDPEQRWLLSIVLVYFVTSWFNYSVALPFNGLVLSAVLALIVRNSLMAKEKKVSLLKFKAVPLMMMVILIPFLLLYGASDLLMRKGKLSTALSVCPLRAEGWYQSAISKMSENQVNEAMSDLNMAIKLDPKNSFYWFRRALLLSNNGPHQRTEINIAFEKARAFGPHHAPFYVVEGFYRFSLKEMEPALYLFQKARELEPQASTPPYGIALVQMERKEWNAAREQLGIAKTIKENESRLRQISSDQKDYFNSPYAKVLGSVRSDDIEDKIKSIPQ